MAQGLHKQDELRIIVLGHNRSGKTATINTFLGNEKSDLGDRVTHSVKREGLVLGRKVTLIDPPGWWKAFPATQTAEYIKRELVLSVSLCPPGPHVFILTVELDSQLTETEQTSLREHFELLGPNIWEHSIVLFTKGDLLMDRTIEERIKNKEETLDWLVRRCGGRYHVFHNKTECDDQSQVKTLLDKIDELIASNHHRHYEVAHIKLTSTEEEKKAGKENGLKFKQKVLEERQKIRINGEMLSLPEIRILLIGWVFSGKSYAGNIILNGDHFSPGQVTEKAESSHGNVFGRNLTVVDTPGWWKFLPTKYTPKRVKAELERGVSLCGKFPQAVLLTMAVETLFRDETRRIVQETMETYFGEDIWRHTIVLFTWGHLLKETTIEELIESEGKPLKWLVQKCGNRYHVFGETGQSSNQVAELLEKIEEMVAGNCVFCPRAEISLCTETAVEKHKVGKDDPYSEDAVNILDREWLRRDKRIIEEVQKKWAATVEAARKQKSNSSRNEPPWLKGEQPKDTVHYGETSQNNSPHGEVTEGKGQIDRSDDQTLHRQQSDDEMLAGHLKDLLENEWKRRDFIVRDLVREAVKELKMDMTSEPDKHERQQAIEKVSYWLTKSSGLGSEPGDEDIS